ncbi:MAG: hypothetical protein GY719_42795 [bacterium]|nr:hypothetical protein [bacterium]
MNLRLKDTADLHASVRVLERDTVEGVSAKLGPVLAEGERLPDFALALELVVRRTVAASEGLWEAHERYLTAGTRRHDTRKECERLARRKLNPAMRDVRKTAEALYGRELGRDLHGLKGKTLRKPGRVMEQARDIVGTLRGCLRKPPRPDPALTAHLEAWLRLVQRPYDRLVAATMDLAGCEQEQNRVYELRQEAFEHFDGAYVEALDVVAAVYRLAGFSDRNIRWLRSKAQRRRLRREAEAKKARRGAKRAGRVRKTVRAAVRSVSGWRFWRRAAS